MIYVVLWYYLYGFMWLYGLRALRGVATAREATVKSIMSGLLRGRRLEEMTQSNTSSPRGSELPFESQRG